MVIAMKNFALALVAILVLLGCVANTAAQDKSIEINSGSMKTKFGSASAITKNNSISFRFSSPSLSSIELQNSSFALTTCNASAQDVLLDAIQRAKKEYCQANKCILQNISHSGTELKLGASCTQAIAEPGKLYVVYLNLTAKLKKDNYLSVLDFRSCETSQEEYDVCSAAYSIVMQKS